MARGRSAQTPFQIPVTGWKDVAFRVKDEIAADRVSLVAAGIAFYGLLALFPAITALVAISGLLVEPGTVVEQVDRLSGLLPEDVVTIVTDQASAVAGSEGGGLGMTAVVGLLLAFYSASKGVASVIEGLNVAYDEQETRGFIRLKLVTFAFTLLFLVFALAGLGAAVVLPVILAILPAGIVVQTLATILLAGLLAGLAIVGLAALYHFGPCRDSPEWRWISLGALVACVIWVVASAGFAFYVGNFASYNETFGTLGGVIVLLMWLWLSAFIVLMGAELNAELEAQTAADTTVGPDEPMGQRGAVKADKLGAAKSA